MCVWRLAIFARGGFPHQIQFLSVHCVRRVCVCSSLQQLFRQPGVCVCSSGGLAAEEPGQCFERGPMRSHTHIEEKTPKHPELYAGFAQERPLETTGPAGKYRQHVQQG